MKLTQDRLIGILGAIGMVIGLVISTSSWLAGREESLSRKIISAQNIIPHCGLPENEETRILNILLEAEQKLNIEGRYSEAANLLNSINAELLTCQPKMEISEPILMVWTVLVGMLIIFILLAAGKLKKSNDTKRNS